MVKNGNFTFLLLELLLADEVADLLVSIDPYIDLLADLPPNYWYLVVRNSNFTVLLLEFILADQLVDLPPNYWHLVVRNSNSSVLLLEFILADHMADLLSPVQCIMGCLLWDVIGSHCGFFKKRWEFAFISE